MLGGELGFVDDRGHAEGERSDDAVRHPGHPSRIGGAPEHVVRVQVEHALRGVAVSDDRLVNVERSLGLAGRATREVEQRGRLRIGVLDRERRRRLFE